MIMKNTKVLQRTELLYAQFLRALKIIYNNIWAVACQRGGIMVKLGGNLNRLSLTFLYGRV